MALGKSHQFLERHRGTSVKRLCSVLVHKHSTPPPSEVSVPEPAAGSQTRLFSFSWLGFFLLRPHASATNPSRGSNLSLPARTWGLGPVDVW